VCLANSRKTGGRCVAGKEISESGHPGNWIRPVSAREHEEIRESEQRLGDGAKPRVLDVIDVPVIRARPKGYQQENWLLDPKRRWAKVGRIAWGNLPRWADQSETLWINGHNSGSGLNDRVPEDLAYSLDSSLSLIKIERLEVLISRNLENNAYRLRGRFSYRGNVYSLRITDPVSEQAATELGSGSFVVDDDRFLTVSLGEPFEGFAYKLIAAIIRP